MENIMSDKKVLDENQLKPELMGVCTNLVAFPHTTSPTRSYMVGGMIPKAVVTEGASERKIKTGNEYQYAETARKVVAPSNMVVEEIFYVRSLAPGSENQTDRWNTIYVVFKNDEKNAYDVLELPRYHTQNSYIAFEYKYDKKVMRKLEIGATFAKGTIFAQSPRISDSGEWCFGMDLKVALGSFLATEEDGIVVTESCARDKLRCVFEHTREFGWNESDYIPLMLYGSDDDPKPFPECGESIRPDGIVMGFRRRVTEHALVSLTKKALRQPDHVHDILFLAPTDSEVMAVEVISERMKRNANNRSTEYIKQQHTNMLDSYERRQNEMWNNIISWYDKKVKANRGEPIPLTDPLDSLVRFALGSFTRSASSNRINPLQRAVKRQRIPDWQITIKLRQRVIGRTKFKMSGMSGDKGVIVNIIPDADAPAYEDGTTAEVIVNNTPAFRRQVYSMLMEQSINFINLNLHKDVTKLRNEGKYKEAFEALMTFYETGFPEFAEIVKRVVPDEASQYEHVDTIVRTQIAVAVRSDSPMYGVKIIEALRNQYKYEPQRIWFTNSLGERVLSKNPVMITSQHFLLLDKFGTDMSAQSLPHANIFGMPAKLNDVSKHASFLRKVQNRNAGEDEVRLRLSQSGAKEVAKNLAMGYSPELREEIARRIIRADDPFEINQLVKPEEYKLNRALRMSVSMLSDSGIVLRKETPLDRSEEK